MKKWIALLLAAALSLGSLAGCGTYKNPNEGYIPTGAALLGEDEDPAVLEPEKEEQSITLAYNPGKSMNPLIATDLSNRVLLSLMYQGLFAVDSNNNPTPILCDNYQVSADNRTYTYYLDPNAKFSDGTPVTVEDVLATYEAARTSRYYKGRFLHVYQIDSISGGIRFILNTAYQDFSMLLDIPILKAGEVEADFPLGTGPYTFGEGPAGASLSRNPNWWCGDLEIPARARVIPLVEVTSQSELRDQFEFGEVSLACANPLSDSYADFRCDYELWEVNNGYFLFLTCNVLYNAYFKDSDILRKALPYAIDREWLAQENYRGLCWPSTLAVSPGSPYYYESLASKYGYDSQKFVESLAGWDPPKPEIIDGKKQPQKKLTILVNCDDSARLRTARDIADTLTELGIPAGTLEYSNNTNPTLEVMLRSGNYSMYLGQTRLSPNNDLSAFFRVYGGLDYGGLPTDELYKMARETLADRGNYYNLEQKVAEDARVIPILFGYDAVYAKRGVFENLHPSRDNVFYYSIGKTMTEAKLATVYE